MSDFEDIQALQNKEVTRLKLKQSELKSIQAVLRSPEGQVLCKYLIRTFCMKTTLDVNPQITAFKEGQRALAMQIVGTAHKADSFAPQIQSILAEIEEQQEE